MGNINNIEKIISNFQQYSIKLINESIDNGRNIAQSQAGTEAESSKDYNGRIVFEFFQNAVDRAEENIWMELTKDSFTISNDGQPFSIYKGKNKDSKKSDFFALNTIHDGSKTAGESIGNKGVGFKSCWNVSNHVIIESQQDDQYWGFELFNPVSADNFENEEIKKAINEAGGKVPSFYFPKYKKSFKENFQNGAVTKITIFFDEKNRENSYNEIKSELEEFSKAKFFFLNQLKDKNKKEYTIYISIDGNKNEPLTSNKDSWEILSLGGSYKELHTELIEARKKEKYKNIPENPNIAIAFPPENGDIDSKFYTYLPTKINCGFNVLIHADFALDNARVSIPDNAYNNKILEIAAKIFVDKLLNNEGLHKREDFAKFLMPNHRDDMFAQKVWKELIDSDNLTKILKRVYTKDRKFPIESYERIFEVINKWTKDKTDRNWGTHYESVYNDSLKYFCNEEIYIVWIDKNITTFLPSKKQTNEYEYSLFFKSSDDRNELNFSLLSDVKNLKITSFDSFGNKDLFIHNKIIRKFSTLEIVRALKNIEDINVIKFIKQLIDNIQKDEIGNELKKQLLEIKIPTKNSFQPISRCYINIDKDIKELFDDNFFEVDIEKLDSNEKWEPFLTKIGVANNRLPFDDNKLPFKNDCKFLKSNKLKDFIDNSLDFLTDEIIDTLTNMAWFWDERKNKLYKPSEVFLFKEHDNRKIQSIAQEKKDSKYDRLYSIFNIQEIDDTKEVEKLIKQLNKMKTFKDTEFHDDIYKKLTYQLSKYIKDEDSIDIPILAIQLKDHSLKYIDNNEKNKTIFLETKYKRYREQLKNSYEYIAYFDNNISEKFLEKLGIVKFNPNYEIKYWDSNNKDIKPNPDNELKIELQNEFLIPFFALANEVLGSSFSKEDAIKRWENLTIKKAPNVVFQIKDKTEIIVESTKDSDIDVLYIPIKDKSNHPTEIGEVAHDLENPMKNPNLRKFAQVFAEGIIRNQKLKSDFELYITAYLHKDDKLKEEICINKGVDHHHIKQVEDFIKENLLNDDEKGKIVSILKELGLNIEMYEQIRDYEKYKDLNLSFNDFKDKFNKKSDYKFENLISSVIEGYKNYIKQKILNQIYSNKEKLQVLCFMKEYNRESFDEKYRNIEKKIIDRFNTEIDIYKLFEVGKNIVGSDDYIESQIDLKYFTEEVKSEKINFRIQNHTIETKENPTTGDAKQSKSQTKTQEEKNEKIGLGQELKLAYKFAKQIKNKKSFIEMIKKEIYKNDEKLKDNKNLTNYYQNLDKQIDSNNLEFAKNVIQIANNKLDGLGYDLIIPIFNNDKNEVIGIKKVELKTTKRDQNIQVHFSDNEIKRALHYMDVDNWEVWLNNEKNLITSPVREAIKKLPSELPFSFTDYILTLEVKK